MNCLSCRGGCGPTSQAVNEYRGGQQIGRPTRRRAIAGECVIQIRQCRAPGGCGRAARGQHAAGAGLHGSQPARAGTVQHTGIIQHGHEGRQRIQACGLLTAGRLSDALQYGECVLDDRPKTFSGDLARAGRAVAGDRLFAV